MTTMHTESEKKTISRVRITIKCRIDKFESLVSQEEKSVLLSEGVSSPLVPRAIWKLCAYPYPSLVFFDVYLTGPMKESEETLEASCHIYLIGKADGETHSIYRGTYEFGSYGIYFCLYDPAELDLDLAKKALHTDGSLLVAADIEFLVPDDCAATAEAKSDLITEWQGSIGKLLENGPNSDCTIVVGDKKLKAHRLILSAVSPTFAEMFGNDGFQEARDGIVRIEDSTAEAVRAMLDFAYKGCIDWARYSECKRDVLILACKYLIDALKHHVERQLAREITVESYTEMAILYDAYSCELLKKACLEFLCDNCLAVVLTPQWDALLLDTRVDLARELLRHVRESKSTTTVTTYSCSTTAAGKRAT